MKKLMTMLAAVGMAFGLFADDPLNNTWLATDGTYPTGWSGATDKAKIEGGVLKVATGSDALKRTALASGAFATVSNVYFDVNISLLGQALDELPTADQLDGAKFGLFVLAGNELEGAPLSTTNLFAIGYNDDAPGKKALYDLGDWSTLAATADRITINAYANVLATGTRAGFTVFIDGVDDVAKDAATVEKVYWFDANDNVVWENKMTNAKYLGANVVVDTPLLNWYSNQKHNLILGLVGDAAGASFTGIDFIGNAEISAVAITETKPTFIGPDFTGMTVDADTGITITGANYENGVITDSTILTLTYDGPIEKYVFTATPDTYAKVDRDQVTVTFAAGESFHIGVSEAKATVTIGGTTWNFANIGEAIAKANGAEAAAEIKLFDAVTEEEIAAFDNAEGITLDLNGQTITLEGIFSGLSNSGVLTIIDTSDAKSGKVACSVSNEGTLNLEAGTFDGAVENSGTGVVKAYAGTKFINENEKTTIEGYAKAAGDDLEVVEAGDDYWKVQKITVTPVQVPTTVSLTYNSELQTAYADTDDYTVSGQVSGTDAGTYTATFTLKDEKHNKWADDSFEGSLDWTIAKAAATVTPKADQTKEYSGDSATDPTFTYDVTLLGTDTLEGALAREAGEDVGAYAFTLGTLANDNYELTLADNAPKFTITAKAVTVTVELDKTEANVDEAAPVVTVKFDGAAAADGSFDTVWEPTLDMTKAGDYICTATAKGNYSGTSEGVKFTVKSAAAPVPGNMNGGSKEQKDAYTAWVAGLAAKGITIDTSDDATAIAFALEMTDEDLKGYDTVEKAVEAMLATKITPEMVAAIAAGGLDNGKLDEATFKTLEGDYVNAEFTFVPATELESTDTAKFYHLSADFKPANSTVE